MLLRFVTGVTGHIETFIVNNYNKVLFQPVTPVTLFSNENTPDLKLAILTFRGNRSAVQASRTAILWPNS